MLKLCLLLWVVGFVFGEGIDTPKDILLSNNIFAAHLYHEIDKSSAKNIAYSGNSLLTILTLLSLGATGETASQLKTALNLNISDEQIKKDFKVLSKQLKSEGDLTVYTANRAYLADNIQIEPDFLKIATEDFDSDVENVNFADAKVTADKINAWVDGQTHHKIKNLVSENQLSGLTRFVLVSTLYFNGKWLHPFPEYDTEKRDFHRTNTEIVQVDTMRLTAHLPYQHNPILGIQVVELPYVDKRAKFYIIVPHEIDGLATAEKRVKEFAEHQNLTRTYVKLFLPKFRVESSIDLIPVLKNLGVTKLFDKPELTGITKEDIAVSAILQKTFVDVSEHGTEAASASAAEGENRSLHISREQAVEFKVDRPFIFCIEYDGLYLIAGRVTSI